jgi:hypothetical protein
MIRRTATRPQRRVATLPTVGNPGRPASRETPEPLHDERPAIDLIFEGDADPARPEPPSPPGEEHPDA